MERARSEWADRNVFLFRMEVQERIDLCCILGRLTRTLLTEGGVLSTFSWLAWVVIGIYGGCPFVVPVVVAIFVGEGH